VHTDTQHGSKDEEEERSSLAASRSRIGDECSAGRAVAKRINGRGKFGIRSVRSLTYSVKKDVCSVLFIIANALRSRLVVDRIRGSGLEGSSLLAIFEGERKGSSPWSGARAFKKYGHRALYTIFLIRAL
jgi:hypothetical protein